MQDSEEVVAGGTVGRWLSSEIMALVLKTSLLGWSAWLLSTVYARSVLMAACLLEQVNCMEFIQWGWKGRRVCCQGTAQGCSIFHMFLLSRDLLAHSRLSPWLFF